MARLVVAPTVTVSSSAPRTSPISNGRVAAADRIEQLVRVGDGCSGDRHDQVTPQDSSSRCRALVLDFTDEQAGPVGQADRPAQAPRDEGRGDRNSEPGTLDRSTTRQ